MAYVDHCDRSNCVIDIVDHSIIAGPDPPAVTPLQFLAVQRARICSEAIDCSSHPFEVGLRQRREFARGARQEKYRIVHFRCCAMFLRTCS